MIFFTMLIKLLYISSFYIRIENITFLNCKLLLGENERCQISESKYVSKWINNYLHCLRFLGNESVHLINKQDRIPESLSSGDLLVIFSNILRVLDFYIQRNERKKVSS
jgi:hypothetical protein